MLHRVTLTALALSVSSSVTAQVIQAPPRQIQPPPPASVNQNLDLNVTLLGGYDRSPGPLASAVLPPVGALARPTPSGAVGTFDSALTYDRTSPKRTLNASTRGYVNSYQSSGTGALYGGDASGSVGFLGRRDTLRLSQSFQLAPFYSVGVLGPVGGVAGNPTIGFTHGQTWGTTSFGSWSHEWTRRTSMTASYSYGRFGHSTVTLPGQYRTEFHSGRLNFNRTLGRNLTAHGGVKRSATRNPQSGAYQFTIEDGADGGFSYTHRVSATRGYAVSARGGASLVHWNGSPSQAAFQAWVPTFSSSFGFDLARSWRVSSDYSRSVNVPSPLNTSQTAYATDNIGGGVGGNLSDRLEMAASTTLTRGHTPVGASLGGTAIYRAYMVTGQLQYHLTRSLSTMLNVGYVETQMNAAASLSFGVVPNLRRTQVRGGFTWNLPLAGRQGN
jgi:hypothetical protein